MTMMLVLLSPVWSQQRVSGQVTDGADGSPLSGASVIVKGTNTGAVTDDSGNFAITAGSDAVLQVSFVGYVAQEISVGNQTFLSIALEIDERLLEEVVITGYTSERKADIIGSVAVVNTEKMLTTPAANLTAQLQGRAAGVVVSGSGEPGAGAKVRIRGFTSFGNSDPLYVIDGVPTTDPSKVNPNDIASIQVLKDATAASIYGARAAQGVVIITTKGGTAGALKLTYDGFAGYQYIPQNTMPEMLNTSQYLEYLQKNQGADFNHPVFGRIGDGQVPDRIVVGGGFKGGVAASDPRADASNYSIEDYSNVYQIMETSAGTNWFQEITRPGLIQNHQLTASGGTNVSNYAMSFNYFGQEGTFEHTDYDRYSIRVNSSFKPKKWLRIGENVQVIYEEYEGNANRGEGGAWAMAYRTVPYLPVYDIGGGWGGNAVGESGNSSNPVSLLYRAKDNQRYNYKIFGNSFVEIMPFDGLTLRSSFGIDYGNFFNKSITYRTYENSENTSITGLNTSYNYNLSWTWTNTATYSKTFGNSEIKLLAGTEAIKFLGDGIGVGTNTFDFEDPVFINLNTDQFATPSAFSSQPVPSTLASMFGRADYIFNNKYLVNATIRRDGSSKFAPEQRYGVFPAFGVGWRVSEESFLSGVSWLDDLKIRFGWGQSGSERNVNPSNQFTLFSSAVGISNYDINRSQNGVAVGYTPYRAGSLTTKWEVSETTNIGLDGSILTGALSFGLNYFINNTNDLLIQRQKNGVEPQVQQPFINLGQMQNKGFEVNLTHYNQIGDFEYDITGTFTHYKNTVVDIDGNPESFFAFNASRMNNVTRTQSGSPISYFTGFVVDGFFETQEQIDALDQPGAVIGSWRFQDLNGDNVIDDDDRTFLGSPHPDFIMGLNIDLRWKNFDFNGFLIWNQGNELFNYTKHFTDMRIFVGGVSTRVLDDAYPNGALPLLAPGAESGYTPLIRSAPSSYYVEDGSYLRGKTFQLGYNLPASVGNRIGLNAARIYLQGQNMFTITKYTGPDPDINIIGGDDRYIGVDVSGFPNSRQVIFGLSLTL